MIWRLFYPCARWHDCVCGRGGDCGVSVFADMCYAPPSHSSGSILSVHTSPRDCSVITLSAAYTLLQRLAYEVMDLHAKVPEVHVCVSVCMCGCLLLSLTPCVCVFLCVCVSVCVCAAPC